MEGGSTSAAPSVGEVLAELNASYTVAEQEIEAAASDAAAALGVGPTGEGSGGGGELPLVSGALKEVGEAAAEVAECTRVSQLLQASGFAPLALCRASDRLGVLKEASDSNFHVASPKALLVARELPSVGIKN